MESIWFAYYRDWIRAMATMTTSQLLQLWCGAFWRTYVNGCSIKPHLWRIQLSLERWLQSNAHKMFDISGSNAAAGVQCGFRSERQCCLHLPWSCWRRGHSPWAWARWECSYQRVALLRGTPKTLFNGSPISNPHHHGGSPTSSTIAEEIFSPATTSDCNSLREIATKLPVRLDTYVSTWACMVDGVMKNYSPPFSEDWNCTL